MHIVRIIFKIIAGLLSSLVIVACLALWIINFVDWDRHKNIVISGIEAFSPFKVEALEGLKLRLTRNARLELQKINLQARPDATDLSLKRFASGPLRLNLAVWPLFKKEFQLRELTLEDGDVRMQKVANKKPDEAEGEKKDFTLPSLFVAIAQIKTSEFRYDGSDSFVRLALDEAAISSVSERVPTFLFAEGQVKDLPLRLIGQTESLNQVLDQQSQVSFWVDGAIGQQKIDIKGAYAKAKGEVSLTAAASGPNLEEIKEALHLNIGQVPAYKLAFELQTKERAVAVQNLKLTLGRSQLSGRADFKWGGERPRVSADLNAPLLVQSDLAGIFQTDKRYKPANEPPRPAGQYFSEKPLALEGLKKIDVDVCLKVKTFEGAKSGTAIAGGNACLKVDRGDLWLKPLDFGVANGNIAGSFHLDARKAPFDVAINLAARRVDLSVLLAPIAKEVPLVKLKPKDMGRGFLSGNLNLTTTGTNPLEFAQRIQGPIGLVVEDGALSSTVIEAFGIDISQTIVSWFKGHPLYPMKCMLASFEAKKGRFDTKGFLISTSDTSIIGKGFVDLTANQVDYLFNAHPHDFSVGSLRSPIYIKGPLNGFKVGLEKKELFTRGAVATALGVLVNPLLALLPLTETGLDKAGTCKSVVQEMRKVYARTDATQRREESSGPQ